MGWLDLFRTKDEVVDTKQFNDELAERVSWKPLVRGGANFRTRKLVFVSPERLELPGYGLGYFGIFFMLFGTAIPTVIFITHKHMFEDGFNWGMLLMPIIAGVFIGVGIYIFRLGNRSVVFDKRIGYFWIGKKEYTSLTASKMKVIAHLDEIHAFQIIKERVRGNKRSYNSYELNMVLKNGNRINIMDHADYNSIIVDVAVLGEFLSVPIWNAVK